MVVKKKIINKTVKKRKITRQTVRDIHGWLHYPFKQALLHKQSLINGLKVEIISEHLTTKVCDNCGEINNSIGGKKHFKCDYCEHNVNRDVHGARNSCLRNCVGRYNIVVQEN